MTQRKTNPDHKARFLYGCACRCSCGWSSSTWFGKGSKSNAASEFRAHREKCEKKESSK